MDIGIHYKSDLFCGPENRLLTFTSLCEGEILQNHPASENQQKEFCLTSLFLLRQGQSTILQSRDKTLLGMFSDICRAFVLDLVRKETKGQ